MSAPALPLRREHAGAYVSRCGRFSIVATDDNPGREWVLIDNAEAARIGTFRKLRVARRAVVQCGAALDRMAS
jgi:hypothetical protein